MTKIGVRAPGAQQRYIEHPNRRFPSRIAIMGPPRLSKAGVNFVAANGILHNLALGKAVSSYV